MGGYSINKELACASKTNEEVGVQDLLDFLVCFFSYAVCRRVLLYISLLLVSGLAMITTGLVREHLTNKLRIIGFTVESKLALIC